MPIHCIYFKFILILTLPTTLYTSYVQFYRFRMPRNSVTDGGNTPRLLTYYIYSIKICRLSGCCLLYMDYIMCLKNEKRNMYLLYILSILCLIHCILKCKICDVLLFIEQNSKVKYIHFTVCIMVIINKVKTRFFFFVV